MPNSKNRLSAEELNRQKSHKKGPFGFVENFLRNFQSLSYIFGIVPIVGLFAFCLSFAITPLVYFVLSVWQFRFESLLMQSFTLALAVSAGLLTFMLALPLIVVIVNRPLIPLVKAYRGPWFSLESIPWFYHNSLFYLVRYTVLDLLTPTPLSLMFLRGMGMKIGKGSMINTSNISDPCLIEIGDHVTIGGSVYMMAHYGMKGFLIVDKLVVKSKANVGLHSYLMGAVEVGEAAQVLPNTMVLPKTVIPDHVRYGGNPAEIIKPEAVRIL